jgi:hypothetical protein
MLNGGDNLQHISKIPAFQSGTECEHGFLKAQEAELNCRKKARRAQSRNQRSADSLVREQSGFGEETRGQSCPRS